MPTAYFRGRKLHGRAVAIPEDYRGVLALKQEITAGKEVEKSEDDQAVSLDAQEGTLQVAGEFQDMIVWGHESVADPSSDHHIRGMDEWIDVSKKVRRCCFAVPGLFVNRSPDSFFPTRDEREDAVVGQQLGRKDRWAGCHV